MLSKKEIEQNIKNLNIEEEGICEDDGKFIDEFDKERNFYDEVNLADKHIKEKQDTTVTFRWYKKEVELVKKIARKKGINYQAYLKMVIKQAIENDRNILQN